MSYPPSVAKSTRTPMTTERERTIGVRVTDAEYEQIREKAEAMGLRVAAYVRMVALREPTQPEMRAPATSEQLEAMKRLDSLRIEGDLDAKAMQEHLRAAWQELQDFLNKTPPPSKQKNAS